MEGKVRAGDLAGWSARRGKLGEYLFLVYLACCQARPVPIAFMTLTLEQIEDSFI